LNDIKAWYVIDRIPSGWIGRRALLDVNRSESCAADQALPVVGLHGLTLAGYPLRRWAVNTI
jgi:hypothetical protein